MAITAIDYTIWRALVEKRALPARPDVLEIGQANWYGDVSVDQLAEDIQRFAPPEQAQLHLQALSQVARSENPIQRAFDIASVFYKAFLNYQSITAIDLDGLSGALEYDLNQPVPLDRRFDVTINTGTAEHVFNQYQLFKTIHDLTLPGGVIVHTFPFKGWLDHGFYNYNPTFIVDLAACNEYEIVVWLYGELSPFRVVQLERLEQVHEMARRGELGLNAVHDVVLRKPGEERPFTVPMQGYYADKLSARAEQDWCTLR